MNRKYGELVENTLEKVEDVEVKVDYTGWGRFLRVKVEINLTKPLARGRFITVKDENLWIYEKLPCL